MVINSQSLGSPFHKTFRSHWKMPLHLLMAPFLYMEEITMAVIRISKTKGFTVMSNYHLRDQNLSLKAKGLLSMMLSLPDEWHYSIRGLTAICKEGVSSISATIRELEDCGYVRRHQPIIDGKFQEIEYIIYENPQSKSADKDASADAEDSDGTDQAASNPHTVMNSICS